MSAPGIKGEPDFDDDALVLTDPEVVRTLRKKRQNASVERFAEDAGVSDDILKFMEGKLKNGNRVRTRWTNVCNVAHLSGVSPYELLDWSEQQPIPLGWTQIEFAEELRKSAIHLALASVSASAAESSPALIRSTLKNALESIKPLIERGQRIGYLRQSARAYALILTRLADVEQRYDTRVQYRKAAIETLERSCKMNDDPLDVVSWAEAIATFHYDISHPPSKKWVVKQIKRALDAANAVQSRVRIEGGDCSRVMVLILAQITSLLRCRHSYLSGSEVRNNLWRMLKVSDRCLELQPDNAIGLLAAGQAHWAYALNVRDEYTDVHLKTAETLLKKASGRSAIGLLVLSRFYRLTYKQAEAIRVFKLFEEAGSERRLVMMEAHIVAEAARQLWMQDRNSAVAEVTYARRVISEAVEAGYKDSRNICGLAFLEAILGEVDTAKAQLQRLVIEDVAKEWDEVLSDILGYAQESDVDKLRKAFAFGFDTGDAFNSVGTFAAEFLNDQEVALRLYETGLKLSAKSPVLWLNKARVLRRLDREKEVPYALRQAHQYSSTVFTVLIRAFEDGGGHLAP